MNFKAPFFCSFSQKIKKRTKRWNPYNLFWFVNCTMPGDCKNWNHTKQGLPDNNVTAVVCKIHKSQSSLELNLKIVPSFNIAYPTGVLPEYVLFASNRQNMYHQISWKSYHKKVGFKLHNCNYTIRLVISPLVKKSGFCLK